MAKWRHKETGKEVSGHELASTAKWEMGERGELPDDWKDDWEKIDSGEGDESGESETADESAASDTSDPDADESEPESVLSEVLWSDFRAIGKLLGSDESDEEADE